MNIHELISVNAPLLQKLHENGVKISDYKYIQLYEKYLEMIKNGEKITYIVSSLSSTFEICERTVYRLIEFFSATAVL